MRKGVLVPAAAALLLVVAAGAWASAKVFNVLPREFDPQRTHLVQATWVAGLGCPTNAKTADADAQGHPVPGARYTDPACTVGDTRDHRVRGLVLAKTGPTSNYASATARIDDVKNIHLTELGYDIRKPMDSVDPRGSHCGAGAPRFNVRTSDGQLWFIGCNSPPGVQTVGNGWIRLRWGGSVPLMAYPQLGGPLTDISGMKVKSMEIVFDEGQDTGPDNFGMAVLDNIDVNGKLTGTGPVNAG
jgi:hypothetical protein